MREPDNSTRLNLNESLSVAGSSFLNTFNNFKTINPK